MRVVRAAWAWLGVAIVCLGASIPVHAQEQFAKAEVPLIVDGTIRQVFRSTDQSQDAYLVQIEVTKTEARLSASTWTKSSSPNPGESVYVHVAPGNDSSDGTLLEKRRKRLPEVGSQGRAYLTARKEGGWQGASASWFESDDRSTTTTSNNPAAEAGNIAEKSTTLGMTTELVKADRRSVLRVTSVERTGPAHDVGLEVGDLIAAADGVEITSGTQLAELATKGKKILLVVVDVNSGRGARIEIDPGDKPAKLPTDTSAPVPPPASPISLGLSAEPVTIGTRSALKVVGVDPGGPAAKAGLEVGDIVVAANGVPTTGAEQLLNALRKSGPTFKLTVRDSRTGRDVDVNVNLEGVAKTTAPEVDTPIKASPGKLGAVTELAFHNSDFAVKVTEVEPGSSAARAGLRPGILIVAADGKPVLHPNDLNDAVRNSNGTLRLTIVDASTGKKSDLDVNLK